MRIVRTLTPAEVRCYRDHLCRLDPEARRFRFGSTMSDYAVTRYVDGFDGRHRRVIAAFADAVTVIGAVEIAEVNAGEVELAFSVEQRYRRLGIGRTLLNRALITARNRRGRRALLAVQTDNLPMRRLAISAGCRFEVSAGLAESVVTLPPPTAESILAEARAEQAGTAAWLFSAGWLIAASGRRPRLDRPVPVSAGPTELQPAVPGTALRPA